MDGTASVRKPRNPNSPRKTKTPKKEKVKQRKDSDDDEKIKEEVGVAGSSHHTPVSGSHSPQADFQPEHSEGMGSFHGSGENSPFVKREPGSSSGSRYASTPLEEATTPASSFNGGVEEICSDEMYASFGMPGGEYMAEPMMGQSVMPQQYGMGLHIGLGDPYQGLWEPQEMAEGGVPVKREPRWEPAYRQI